MVIGIDRKTENMAEQRGVDPVRVTAWVGILALCGGIFALPFAKNPGLVSAGTGMALLAVSILSQMIAAPKGWRAIATSCLCVVVTFGGVLLILTGSGKVEL